MYARLTTFKIDPAQIGEVSNKFKEIMPAAKALPGILDIYVAWRSDGSGNVTAIYEDRRTADAAAAQLPKIWAMLAGLLIDMPRTEGYENVERLVSSRAHPA